MLIDLKHLFEMDFFNTFIYFNHNVIILIKFKDHVVTETIVVFEKLIQCWQNLNLFSKQEVKTQLVLTSPLETAKVSNEALENTLVLPT